jgi:hypothetical protein
MYNLDPLTQRYGREQAKIIQLIEAPIPKDDTGKPVETENHVKRRKMIQRNIVSSLLKEATTQKNVDTFTRERLVREKAHWFTQGGVFHSVGLYIFETYLASIPRMSLQRANRSIHSTLHSSASAPFSD